MARTCAHGGAENGAAPSACAFCSIRRTYLMWTSFVAVSAPSPER
ncbi:hypothetical protein [Streptomyces sp. NPDC001903]